MVCTCLAWCPLASDAVANSPFSSPLPSQGQHDEVNTSRDYDSTLLATILRTCAYDFAHSNCHPFLPFLFLTGLTPQRPLTPIPVPPCVSHHYVSLHHSVASEEACEARQSATITNPCSPQRSRSRNGPHGSHVN